MSRMLYSILKKITVGCCFVVLISCGSGNQTADVLPNITVAIAQQEDASRNGEFPFIARPYRTSELSFRVEGWVYRFDVHPGNFFQQGESIAEMDARDFQVRKQRAEAIYHQAKAEYERIEVLFQKNNISASNYEKVKADFLSAKANFETALNECNDTRLVAPFSGYIDQVYIENFQEVKVSQPIVSLVDIEKLKIEVYLPQEIVSKIQNQRELKFYFDEMPEHSFSADIIGISKSTTPNNLSYLLTAVFDNTTTRFLSGISGKVLFSMPPTNDSLQMIIPQTALCHNPEVGDFVWLYHPETGCVTQQKVRIGDLRQNGMVIISSGLSYGDQVATSRLRFLSDRMKVHISTSK